MRRQTRKTDESPKHREANNHQKVLCNFDKTAEQIQRTPFVENVTQTRIGNCVTIYVTFNIWDRNGLITKLNARNQYKINLLKNIYLQNLIDQKGGTNNGKVEV